VHDRPDIQDLLATVIAFLHGELRPALPDEELRLRVSQATELLRMVKAELRTEQAFGFRERSGLSRLLPDLETGVRFEGTDAQREAIRELSAALSERILADGFDEAEMVKVRQTLKDSLERRLAVISPRFNTAVDPD